MKKATESFPIGEVLRYDGKKHPLVQALPHYHEVPKDPAKHLEWRLYVRRRCLRSKAWRKVIWKKCEEDVLYFINLCCWIEEPREGETSSGLVPFNTWIHQDPVIASISFYFGRRHCVIDKSRAQGASWLVLCIFLHRFLFKTRQRLGMASITSELADDPDAPESLGWKFDNLWSLLPKWMTRRENGSSKLKRNIAKSTWKNLDNGSTLKAHSATKGLGRAGRYTGYFLDESAFFLPGDDRKAVAGLLPTCNGLIMASTPNGLDNEHSDRLDDPQTWLTAILDWKDNPEQNGGMYTTEDGKLKIIDVQGYPPGYAPVLDGRPRSPWYDEICRTHKNNMIYIAQEYDRDRGGSKGRPFRTDLIKQSRATCKEPLHVGKLTFDEFDPLDSEWEDGDGYKWKLWVPLVNGRPPVMRSTMGIDIAQGTGGESSSNSTASVWNDQTAEQVAEFAAHDLPPADFALMIFAFAHWWGVGGPPLLVPERNAGGGTLFIKAMQELGWTSWFHQSPKEDERQYAKKSKMPGYYNSNRHTLLSPLITELTRGSLTPRSHKMLDEAGEYIFDDQGKVSHPRSVSSQDGSAKGLNHGDRAIAAALAIRGIKSRGGLKKIKPSKPQYAPNGFADIRNAPPGSLGWRMLQDEQAGQRRKKLTYKW